MIRCPCCNKMTICDDDEVIVDICPVCFWQYDATGQQFPNKIIGPNKVSLREARKNYQKFGACRLEMLPYVRSARPDEQ